MCFYCSEVDSAEPPEGVETRASDVLLRSSTHFSFSESTQNQNEQFQMTRGIWKPPKVCRCCRFGGSDSPKPVLCFCWGTVQWIQTVLEKLEFCQCISPKPNLNYNKKDVNVKVRISSTGNVTWSGLQTLMKACCDITLVYTRLILWKHSWLKAWVIKWY